MMLVKFDGVMERLTSHTYTLDLPSSCYSAPCLGIRSKVINSSVPQIFVMFSEQTLLAWKEEALLNPYEVLRPDLCEVLNAGKPINSERAGRFQPFAGPLQLQPSIVVDWILQLITQP